MNYNCDICNYNTYKTYDWNRHLNSSKHIIKCCVKNGDIILCSPTQYDCQLCNISFKKKGNYEQHLKTKKHRQLNNDIPAIDYCKEELVIPRESEVVLPKDLEQKIKSMEKKIQSMEEENKEMRRTMTQGNTTINNNNITNNTLNIEQQTINTKFNLNIFLNEDCKDALNITDFVNSISLTLADLESTARLGYTEGITKIINDRIKEIGVNRRPYHCTDTKRETVYVKDEDLWGKEQNGKPKMKRMITNIIHKNLEQLADWKDANPDCLDLTNVKGEEYLNILIEANGGDEREKKENRILKNIMEEADVIL